VSGQVEPVLEVPEQDAGPLWQPYVDRPLLTPAMALGLDAATPHDQQRLVRYLQALVARRRAPVHVNVAFNAAYFGYDLGGGYVGGAVDLSELPTVELAAAGSGRSVEALPVGALVHLQTGSHQLFTEIVYKEGAHPQLRDDGTLPEWLSGAPTGAVGPGTVDGGAPAELRELLLFDPDAFGADLSLNAKQLRRLCERRSGFTPDEHLLLDVRYPSADDADADEVTFYARYLLAGAGREQLLSPLAPLPLRALLTDDAGPQQLQAVLFGLFGAVEQALRRCDDLRYWRGYFFTRDAFAQRLHDHGPLGGDDLKSVAVQLGRSARPAPGRSQASKATYTALGPALRGVSGADPQLRGLGYATALCHANSVVADYARRDADESTGLLDNGARLHLDDAWQGGGVWRAEYPGGGGSPDTVRQALGVGWLTSATSRNPARGSLLRPAGPGGVHGAQRTRPGAQPAPAPQPVAAEQVAPQPVAAEQVAPEQVAQQPDTAWEPELERQQLGDGLDGLRLLDSQISWRQALRLAHLDEGYLPLPGQVVQALRSAGAPARLRLLLGHPGGGLPAEQMQQEPGTEMAVHPRLAGIDWPLEFFPGIFVTCTWARGGSAVRVTSELLERPVVVDGQEIYHCYDPRILTAEGDPEPAPGRSEGSAALYAAAREVLAAVRRLGRLDDSGRAVLVRSRVADAVRQLRAPGTDPLQPPAVDAAVTQLVAAGKLTEDVASVDIARRLHHPARPGERHIDLVVYTPHVEPGRTRQGVRATAPAVDPRMLRTIQVVAHLRKLPPGQHARPSAPDEWYEVQKGFGMVPRPLPAGHTLVVGFTREG
jgi:hypothetical protein